MTFDKLTKRVDKEKVQRIHFSSLYIEGPVVSTEYFFLRKDILWLNRDRRRRNKRIVKIHEISVRQKVD